MIKAKYENMFNSNNGGSEGDVPFQLGDAEISAIKKCFLLRGGGVKIEGYILDRPQDAIMANKGVGWDSRA